MVLTKPYAKGISTTIFILFCTYLDDGHEDESVFEIQGRSPQKLEINMLPHYTFHTHYLIFFNERTISKLKKLKKLKKLEKK